MNPHVSDETLNELFDGALEGRARAAVEAHLAGCGPCSARREALGAVFAELATLPEAPLGHDLRPGVMAVVRAQSHVPLQPITDPQLFGFKLIFTLQLLVAFVLLAFAWPFLAGQASLVPLIGAADISRFVAQVAGAWLDFGGLWLALQHWLALAATQPALPLEKFLQPVVAGLVLVAGGVLWLLGNALLLRPRPASRLQRNL